VCNFVGQNLKKMKIHTTVRIENDILEILKSNAIKENRTLSNFIIKILKDYIKNVKI